MMAPRKRKSVARRSAEPLRPDRSNRPDRDVCRFEFLFQLQECIACRLACEAHTFNGVERGFYAR